MDSAAWGEKVAKHSRVFKPAGPGAVPGGADPARLRRQDAVPRGLCPRRRAVGLGGRGRRFAEASRPVDPGRQAVRLHRRGAGRAEALGRRLRHAGLAGDPGLGRPEPRLPGRLEPRRLDDHGQLCGRRERGPGHHAGRRRPGEAARAGQGDAAGLSLCRLSLSDLGPGLGRGGPPRLVGAGRQGPGGRLEGARQGAGPAGARRPGVDRVFFDDATHAFDDDKANDPRARYRLDLFQEVQTYFTRALRAC
jgi:hypothetical protein